MKTKLNLIKYLKHIDAKQKEAIEAELSTTEHTLEEMPVIRKNYTIEDEIKEEDQTSSGYLSRIELDHSGDVMIPTGCITTVFEMNPVVLFNHDKEKTPVAKANSLSILQDGVFANWEYAPTEEGMNIKNLVKGGFLNTLSVGFIPVEWKLKGQKGFMELGYPNAERVITKWLLLEFSIVVIPDNPKALITEKNLSELQINKDFVESIGLEVEAPTPIDRTIRLVKSASDIQKEIIEQNDQIASKVAEFLVAKKRGKIIF